MYNPRHFLTRTPKFTMNAQMKTLIAVLSAALISLLPATSMASESEEVRQRVAKIGKLNVGGQAPAPAAAAPTASTDAPAAETASAAPAAAESTGAADPAAQYQTSCFACHGTGAAGSPILGDTAAWAPRIAQGMDTLVDHALNGFNAMPPRGASTFSDDEIKAIVAYLVENSQ